MLAAPCTTTLPDRRLEIKPKPATQIDARTHTAERAGARMGAVYDQRLSDGAVRLYMILDDDSGKRGTAWTGQGTLAGRLRISDRQVRRYLTELEAAGHITRQRGRYGAEFRLSWIGPVRTDLSSLADTRPDRIVQIDAPHLITEPVEPGCSGCMDTGWKGGVLCECKEGRAIWRRMNRRR